MGSVEHLANKQLLVYQNQTIFWWDMGRACLNHEVPGDAKCCSAGVGDPIARGQRQWQGMHVMAVGASCLACFLPEASLGPDSSSSFHEAAALWPGEQLVPLLQVLQHYFSFKQKPSIQQQMLIPVYLIISCNLALFSNESLSSLTVWEDEEALLRSSHLQTWHRCQLERAEANSPGKRGPRSEHFTSPQND